MSDIMFSEAPTLKKIRIKKWWPVESEEEEDYQFVLKRLRDLIPHDISYEFCGTNFYYYGIMWIGKRTEEVEVAIKEMKEHVNA